MQMYPILSHHISKFEILTATLRLWAIKLNAKYDFIGNFSKKNLLSLVYRVQKRDSSRKLGLRGCASKIQLCSKINKVEVEFLNSSISALKIVYITLRLDWNNFFVWQSKYATQSIRNWCVSDIQKYHWRVVH